MSDTNSALLLRIHKPRHCERSEAISYVTRDELRLLHFVRNDDTFLRELLGEPSESRSINKRFSSNHYQLKSTHYA